MSDGYGIYKRQENLTNLQRADPQTRRNAQQLHAHLSARGIKADHLKSMHPSILAHHAAAAGVPESSPGDRGDGPVDAQRFGVGELVSEHPEQKE